MRKLFNLGSAILDARNRQVADIIKGEPFDF